LDYHNVENGQDDQQALSIEQAQAINGQGQS
jgi:hypothetical protein